MIEIDRISHAVGGVPILHDVSLTLPKGGVTALIGPNGAGKSALLSLVARLESVQTGAIPLTAGVPPPTTANESTPRSPP